jgi:phosphatidylglycerophosphatase C
MLERVAWHRREGHDIVIVSASLRAYLDEVARRLGVDALLCTALEVDEHGRCTGRMTGGNCRGAEKATRLRAYLRDRDVTLWAYGDSAGDDDMLAMADHPTRL